MGRRKSHGSFLSDILMFHPSQRAEYIFRIIQ